MRIMRRSVHRLQDIVGGVPMTSWCAGPCNGGHRLLMHAFLRAALVVAAICPAALASAAGAGFDPRVVTFGPAREQLQSTPITDRPYRPLHVYGNSVRRRHERAATSRPSPSRPRPSSSQR
ncbi:MAG: hypothetical protein EBS51_15545 [Planctomycetia bacterium]|nr:hypothetical protein [Planctomycetia bacterium]